jgi:hypothetical protein
MLVLPALLLRALIPAGFMPLAGAGGAYLGLCPGAAPASAPREFLGHDTEPHRHGHGGAPRTHQHPACIFSFGATTASAAALSLLSAMPLPMQSAARAVSLVLLPPILRAQSSRGPPRPG